MSEKKSILVTGCSLGGIGDALAQAFYGRGHMVIATARDLSRVEHLKTLGLTVIQLDVTDLKSIENAVRTVSQLTNGRLDVLVNSSGIGYSMPFLDCDLDLARRVFETNLIGRVATTKAFASFLIASKGTVLNIGSINGLIPTPWSSMYNACCAAGNSWSDTLRLEMSPFGVKVILVITGAVISNFNKNLPVKELPPGSLFLPAKDIIEPTMCGAGVGATYFSTDQYAEGVVENILRQHPKKHYWIGVLTTRIWMGTTFLWSTAWDYILPGSFGIVALKKILTTGPKESKCAE